MTEIIGTYKVGNETMFKVADRQQYTKRGLFGIRGNLDKFQAIVLLTDNGNAFVSTEQARQIIEHALQDRPTMTFLHEADAGSLGDDKEFLQSIGVTLVQMHGSFSVV